MTQPPPDDQPNFPPKAVVPKDGIYEAVHRYNGNTIDKKPFCKDHRFTGVRGYSDSVVLWSSEPVQPRSCPKEVDAGTATQ